MSYLTSLRFHFAGSFLADASTGNNVAENYRKSSEGGTIEPGFNPGGSGSWRLKDCRVRSAWLEDGSAVEKDPVLNLSLVDADSRAAAKIVDLDPYQQLVSMIYGLEISLTDSSGRCYLRGEFHPAPFADIWDRCPRESGSDEGAGAMYQSVVTQVRWGDVSDSPFLTLLKARVRREGGNLSIKFNLDGFSQNQASPTFCRGRIVGTLGVQGRSEPRHFVLGRHLIALGSSFAGFFTPQARVNHCVATLVPDRRKIRLDLGNALPTSRAGVKLLKIGDVDLMCLAPQGTNLGGNFPSFPIRPLHLGTLSMDVYRQESWYERTAGIVEFPEARSLTAEEWDLIQSHPLALMVAGTNGLPTSAVRESPRGLHVRPDDTVFRLGHGQESDACLHASRFGKPLVGARVISFLDPEWLQPMATGPRAGEPAGAIEFPTCVRTDRTGRIRLPIRAQSPEGVRAEAKIDGQVYGIRCALEETLAPNVQQPFNPWDFISVLVWDSFEFRGALTWFKDIRKILKQYAGLYPVMKRVIDLDDYVAICANRKLLLRALRLPETDPNHMPSTRDLSPSKRAAIVRWLETLGPDGLPVRGKKMKENRIQSLCPLPSTNAAGQSGALPSRELWLIVAESARIRGG